MAQKKRHAIFPRCENCLAPFEDCGSGSTTTFEDCGSGRGASHRDGLRRGHFTVVSVRSAVNSE